jgi:hypothetical protein
MAKYRKKPVVVDAFQLNDWRNKFPDWFEEAVRNGKAQVFADSGEFAVLIHTLEGTMGAVEGDYIIQGVNGEIYPCKPDIFAKTYEPHMEEMLQSIYSLLTGPEVEDNPLDLERIDEVARLEMEKRYAGYEFEQFGSGFGMEDGVREVEYKVILPDKSEFFVTIAYNTNNDTLSVHERVN